MPKSTTTTPRSGDEHEVLRLDVAVDRLLVVDVAQRLRGLERVADDVPLRQPRIAVAPQHVREIIALDPLHHQVAPAGVLDHAEHLDHARVVEPAQQPALDLEAGRVALVEQPLGRHAAPVRVGGLVDAAHRSLRDRRSKQISADELRARRWSVHGADGTAATAGKPIRTACPDLGESLAGR